MQSQRVDGVVKFDEKTGKLDFSVQLVGRGRRARRFLKLYQDEMLALVEKHPGLQGKTLRVLLYLVGKGDYQNKAPSTGRVALALGMHQSHVSRAYRELLEAGALVQIDGVYHVSPSLCWKGTERQLDEMYRLLAAEDQRALQAPRIEVR